MYTKTERWTAHCFNKFDFEEELADGTLFEDGETRWILKESPERTTKTVLSSFGDDGLKRRRGERGCSDTEVAIYENVCLDCGNGTIALGSTEMTIEGKKKQSIGIWTEKTGFSLEKVEQIMYLPS
ncbi:hypothetical protein AVEN_186774-1 [Araneus ventricosus]|uniref:Uncharacterized protein n=1 Tax=Araneus ventricosus TaxID=182803 RepID=A0A4Y2SLJ6_ARAVE|nr:hypothetical protein AVEN_267552-1 [Araneus ventricosus]GBN89142.1 hypothetical protein AVEN_186774-1 [Araneus ventricosus]